VGPRTHGQDRRSFSPAVDLEHDSRGLSVRETDRSDTIRPHEPDETNARRDAAEDELDRGVNFREVVLEGGGGSTRDGQVYDRIHALTVRTGAKRGPG
jgi:hypothetical protein